MTNLLTLLLSVAAASKIYVLYGPSQAGKSSFINEHPVTVRAKVGNGCISTTTVCKEYHFTRDNEHIILLDVPGFGDNLMNTTDEEIMGRIKAKINDHLAALILETKVDRRTIDGVILFEPLDYDYSQLRSTIAKAETLFGPTIYESAMVVFTKGDLCYARDPDTIGHLPFCNWQSGEHISATVKEENWRVLKQKLSGLKSYHVHNMDKVMEDVEKLAREACARQEARYVDVEVDEIHQEKVGDREVKTKRFKDPEQRTHQEHYQTHEDVLNTSARSYVDLRADFINIYSAKINAIGRRKFNYAVFPQIEMAAGICAEIYIPDHTHKTAEQLQNELRARWPWGQVADVSCHYKERRKNYKLDMTHMMRQAAWLDIISNSKHIGSGTTTYRRVTHDHVKVTPYTYVEEYYETTYEPVYESRTKKVKKQTQAPPREQHEFVDTAKEQMAQTIRRKLQETM